MSGEEKKAPEKWVCVNCGWIYDPEKSDPPRGFLPPMPFESLPDDWKCPICYADKDSFDLL
ncbi:MAG: rubredoxin [Myxococcota bacterium]